MSPGCFGSTVMVGPASRARHTGRSAPTVRSRTRISPLAADHDRDRVGRIMAARSPSYRSRMQGNSEPGQVMAVGRARLLSTLVLLIMLLMAPAARAADPQDCTRLPTATHRPRPCNPRQECLGLLRTDLSGAALDAARNDCTRLPTSGTCYGPDTYDPQAECRARQGRR